MLLLFHYYFISNIYLCINLYFLLVFSRRVKFVQTVRKKLQYIHLSLYSFVLSISSSNYLFFFGSVSEPDHVIYLSIHVSILMILSIDVFGQVRVWRTPAWTWSARRTWCAFPPSTWPRPGASARDPARRPSQVTSAPRSGRRSTS